VVSVKELSAKNKQNRKVEKGGIYKALITETKKGIKRKDGSIIKFNRNAALLLSEQGNPLGTRILGTLTYELRKKNQTKVLSLASRVL
jgi:large subunit ribosomal protein L14